MEPPDFQLEQPTQLSRLKTKIRAGRIRTYFSKLRPDALPITLQLRNFSNPSRLVNQIGGSYNVLSDLGFQYVSNVFIDSTVSYKYPLSLYV